MHQGESIKYLGDNVHESGKIQFNILERRAKPNGAFAEIRAILEDVPLGKYRTEVGLHLRQALFINGVLFNSETWHGVKSTDIDLNVLWITKYWDTYVEHMQKHQQSFSF